MHRHFHQELLAVRATELDHLRAVAAQAEATSAATIGGLTQQLQVAEVRV